jgi:hypothetical protein
MRNFIVLASSPHTPRRWRGGDGYRVAGGDGSDVGPGRASCRRLPPTLMLPAAPTATDRVGYREVDLHWDTTRASCAADPVLVTPIPRDNCAPRPSMHANVAPLTRPCVRRRGAPRSVAVPRPPLNVPVHTHHHEGPWVRAMRALSSPPDTIRAARRDVSPARSSVAHPAGGPRATPSAVQRPTPGACLSPAAPPRRARGTGRFPRRTTRGTGTRLAATGSNPSGSSR